FHQVPHDCQPKAKSCVLSRCSTFCLTEPIKHIGQEFGFNALSGIAHSDLDVRVDAFYADLNTSSPLRKFDRIREEIPHHLLESAGITGDRARIRIEYCLKPDSFGFSGR